MTGRRDISSRLCEATLAGLPGDVARPGYDRAARGVGIVHIGIGAFHRAHQAAYVDKLLAQSGGDWRIRGISMRSAAVRDQMEPQQGLYTLIERDGDGERLRVVGAVSHVVVAGEDPRAAVDAIADPRVAMVTLTITEKGYCHDPATGALNLAHPDIMHDLANPDTPRSAIGLIAAALRRRQRQSGAPLTLVSCDNLAGNGDILRAGVGEFLDRLDGRGLARWMDRDVAFPRTMVDRIVPATTPQDIDALAARLGVLDRSMVKAEPFGQWVIEDRFAGPRPPLDLVGVQFVPDVRPYELAKLRMLNGSHSLMAYLGLAMGFETVDQAIGDPRIAGLVTDLMRDAAATLPPDGAIDTTGYAAALCGRFANPALDHRLAQIAIDGSNKLPPRLVAPIVERHAQGKSSTAAAVGIAAWMRHIEAGRFADPLENTLRAAIDRAGGNRHGLQRELLSIAPVFGIYGDQQWFAAAIGDANARIDRIVQSSSVAPADARQTKMSARAPDGAR